MDGLTHNEPIVCVAAINKGVSDFGFKVVGFVTMGLKRSIEYNEILHPT